MKTSKLIETKGQPSCHRFLHPHLLACGLAGCFLIMITARGICFDDDSECWYVGPGGCTPAVCNSNCDTDGICDPNGMPRWFITEPALNSWLRDTPLRYNPSRGRSVSLKLFYKNRQGTQGDADTGEPKIFSVGTHWHTPWRVYLQAVPNESTNFWVHLGQGIARKYTVDKIDYLNRAKLTQSGGTNVLEYSFGGKQIFGKTFVSGGVNRYFLTREEDPNGNPTMFEYLETNGTIRLDRVIDADNRTIAFEYAVAGNFSNAITKVIAPHGLTNILSYDSSGRLTNIVDVIGLSSSMEYDNANLTALVTPYGTNKFTYFTNALGMYAVKVVEQDVRKHFYMYNPEVDGGKVPYSYSDYLPSTTNSPYFSMPNTFDSTNTHSRNSFHWNPRQYERLSNLVRTNLDSGSFNVSNLTSADYLIGRQKHWLKAYGGTNAGMTVSLYRDPSPDGTLQGQITWYDYANKEGGDPEKEGTMKEPRFVARKLPNGEARFSCADRNPLGYPTNEISTYTGSNGACQARTNQYEYASNGIDLIRKVQLLGSTSRQVVSNIYNAFHQIVTNYDALDQRTIFTYNSKNQLLTMKTPAGLTKSNIYEGTGTWSNFLAKAIELELNSTNSFTYTNGYIHQQTDPRGLTITDTADPFGRLTQRTYPDGTSENRTYDKLHLVRVTDRLGFTNQFVYNGFRQRIQAIDARNGVTTFDYCSCGSLDSVTDPAGKTTTFSYDLKGRRCVTNYPGGSSVTNHYNLMGQITNVIDSSGYSITNCFNNQGLLCVVSNAFGRRKMLTHDIEDNQIQVIDANSVTNNFTHDELGRRTKRTDGNNQTETFTYSAAGRIAHTNQLAQVTRFQRDVGQRRTAETNANGEVLTYTYNTAGDLIKVTDGEGRETTWGYDQYGRITSKTNDAGSEVLRYAYDANGRLTNRWSLAKGNTRFVYDSAGNLTLIDYPTSPDITMQYDANNRLTNMIDAAGTTRFGYTDWGAVLSEDGPWENDTITYSYTTNRLRSKFSLLQANASAWEQTYAYDRANRLTNLVSPAGAFSYLHDPTVHLQVCKLGLPNTSYVTNTYDALGRLTGTYLKNSSGSILNSHAYTYDHASHRTRQTRTAADYADYGYDYIGQLKTAKGYESGGTARAHEQLGYTYDEAGNLNYRTNNALTQSFNANNLNQLTTVTRSGTLTVAGTTTSSATNVDVNTLTATRYADNTFAKDGFTLVDGTNSFTANAQDTLGRSDAHTISAYLPATNLFAYDGNGNMTTNGTRFFEYDDENQLTRITEPNAWKSEFTYDGRMRRRARKEYTWRSGVWILTNEVRYIYDRNLVIQERDQNDIANVTYTRGKDLSGFLEDAGGIGGLLARTDNGQLATANGQAHAYYQADGNGNITMIVNTQQVAVAKYLYDPFGNILSHSGPLADANLYRFSTKEVHHNSGVIYYLYRYYVPNLQRWLNRDPLDEVSFSLLRPLAGRRPTCEKWRPVTWETVRRVWKPNNSMFTFVVNNPITRRDAYGLLEGCDHFDDRWETDCVLEACARHDDCWAWNNCSGWSWSPIALVCTVCGRCNLQAVADIAACAIVDITGEE